MSLILRDTYLDKTIMVPNFRDLRWLLCEERAVANAIRVTMRAAESDEIAGEGDSYEEDRKEIGIMIAALRKAAREMKVLRGRQLTWPKGHRHEWTEHDYCAICGADGRG